MKPPQPLQKKPPQPLRRRGFWCATVQYLTLIRSQEQRTENKEQRAKTFKEQRALITNHSPKGPSFGGVGGGFFEGLGRLHSSLTTFIIKLNIWYLQIIYTLAKAESVIIKTLRNYNFSFSRNSR